MYKKGKYSCFRLQKKNISFNKKGSLILFKLIFLFSFCKSFSIYVCKNLIFHQAICLNIYNNSPFLYPSKIKICGETTLVPQRVKSIFFCFVFLEFKTNFNFDNESSMTRWNPAEAQRLDSEGVTV